MGVVGIVSNLAKQGVSDLAVGAFAADVAASAWVVAFVAGADA